MSRAAALGRGGLFLAVLVTSVAGCGRRVDRAYPVQLGPADQAIPNTASTGRRCVYANPAEELPALEAVLPAGLGGSLGLWGYGGSREDTVTLSIRYGPEGFLQWVRLVGVAPEGGTPQELERLVGTAVPESGKPDWGVRLRITADGTPVGVLPAVVCPAVRLSQLPTPPPRGTRREWVEMRSARGRRMEAAVLLDDRGRILDVSISQSSGSRLLDQHFLSMIRDTSFRPQLHDGFPVAGIAVVSYDPW